MNNTAGAGRDAYSSSVSSRHWLPSTAQEVPIEADGAATLCSDAFFRLEEAADHTYMSLLNGATQDQIYAAVVRARKTKKK